MKKDSENSAALLYGQDMIERMLNEVDFLPVIQTAVIDCQVETADRALSALEAFLQWFSVLPLVDESDNYVMLKGDPDQLWHAAIINTVIYRHICEKYLGKFVDHHPSLATPKAAWVIETVLLIESVFGASMHPVFREWRTQYSVSSRRPERSQAS